MRHTVQFILFGNLVLRKTILRRTSLPIQLQQTPHMSALVNTPPCFLSLPDLPAIPVLSFLPGARLVLCCAPLGSSTSPVEKGVLSSFLLRTRLSPWSCLAGNPPRASCWEPSWPSDGSPQARLASIISIVVIVIY
jgi:hypothetical protein